MELGEYCLSGPMTTPHVVVQQNLAPGERRSIVADLPPGAYRLRDLEPGQATDIDHGGGRFPTLISEGSGVSAGVPAADGTIALENRTAHDLTLLIESRDWIADALTAHQATTLQAFRDLFTLEILRPGDEVAVSQVALMFTDLQRSTQFYERVGDARAYRLVREHFAFLGAAVRRCHGTVVKTIGDAVMAVFAEPADAVAAALDIQRDFAEFSLEGKEAGLLIKMGLHLGPCIAVTLNDRLDYFGSVVNMAARLQGESRGGDIVLSRDLAADPEVAKSLANVSLAEEQADLKGFDHSVTYWRVAPQTCATGSA